MELCRLAYHDMGQLLDDEHYSESNDFRVMPLSNLELCQNCLSSTIICKLSNISKWNFKY